MEVETGIMFGAPRVATTAADPTTTD